MNIYVIIKIIKIVDILSGWYVRGGECATRWWERVTDKQVACPFGQGNCFFKCSLYTFCLVSAIWGDWNLQSLVLLTLALSYLLLTFSIITLV